MPIWLIMTFVILFLFWITGLAWFLGHPFKAGVWLFHDIMGWHEPDDSSYYFDGCSVHSRCRYCKKEIMQDSQGNWFIY